MRLLLICCFSLVAFGNVAAAKPTRFWNLTNNTVTSFALAPAGSHMFGPDLAKADKDGSVDHDERLKIDGVSSGTYDAQLGDDKGRTCSAKNIVVKEGEVFAIEEKQLSCGK